MKQKSLLLSAALLAAAGIAQAAVDKPNVLFILTDDLGYGDVSYLDANSKVPTKNIDAFAKQSVVFRDAHTSSAVSTPTRYGVLTGRYNWRSTLKKGVIQGYSPALIAEGRSTMADMFKASGYTTAFIGKWHLGWNWTAKEGFKGKFKYDEKTGSDGVDYSKPITQGPNDRGFDYSYGFCASLDHVPYVYVENGYATTRRTPTKTINNEQLGAFIRTGLIADDFNHHEALQNFTTRACDYMKQQAKGDKPFFLYLPLPAPHTPIIPTEEYQGKTTIGAYGDFVYQVDAMMGQLLKALDDAGIAENTLVVFTSDNGCSPAARIPNLIRMGHYPNSIYRGQKSDLFDGGHRVPCMVRYPAKFKFHEVNQPVCLNDFYATFAAMTGYTIKDTEAEDSYNLLPSMTSVEEVAPIREAIVHHSMNGFFAIRKGDWKLLLTGSSGGWSVPKPGAKELEGKPDVQLYNMKDDVKETKNLQAKYPEKVKELRDLLIKYIEEGRSTPGEPQKNDGAYPWANLDWMDK